MNSLLQLACGTGMVAGSRVSVDRDWQMQSENMYSVHAVTSNCTALTGQVGSMSDQKVMGIFGGGTVSVSGRRVAGLPKRTSGAGGERIQAEIADVGRLIKERGKKGHDKV